MGLALRKSPDDAARFTDSLRIRCPASLCLSQIKSEHIGGAARPGPGGKEWSRLV